MRDDPYANHDDQDESWLTDHRKTFYQQHKEQQSQKRRRNKRRRRKKNKPQPIFVSKHMRTCKSCGFEAPKETFRRKRCLACQVAAYLNTL